MAKKSAVNRNEMVKRLVKQYAAKRLALTAIANDEDPAAGRAFRRSAAAGQAAAQFVQDPHPQPLRGHRTSARLLSQASHVAHRAAGSRLARPDPRASSSRAGRGSNGSQRPHRRYDARIRNAAMRGRGKVLTPASKLREHVLDVLRDEGLHPRLLASCKNTANFRSFRDRAEVFRQQPVIVEIARVSKAGPARLFVDQGPQADQERPGDLDPVDAKGVMSDSAARDANVGGEVLCRVY